MRNTCGLIGAVICLSASLCATAQAGSSTRKIVLPNPQLISLPLSRLLAIVEARFG